MIGRYCKLRFKAFYFNKENWSENVFSFYIISIKFLLKQNALHLILNFILVLNMKLCVRCYYEYVNKHKFQLDLVLVSSRPCPVFFL